MIPRFTEPLPEFAGTEVLLEETASTRRIDFSDLRLSPLKSHFFSRTYCFPLRASSPDLTISAINRLTIGREQPIISARSSWPISGIKTIPSESLTPARLARSLITITQRSLKGRPSRVVKRRRFSDQKVFRDARIEITASGGRSASSRVT